LKLHRQTVKKEIVELTKLVNTQMKDFSGEESYLKEEFKLKAEIESIRQKNTAKTE